MGLRKHFFRGKRWNFDYSLQGADDAIQMDLHKTLYSFYAISLCYLNLSSQSLVWNVFYTPARNAFSFHKPPSINVFEHFLRII